MVIDIKEIVEPYKGRKGAAIPVLQAVQEELGYISPESLDAIADALGASANEVYGVATFYSQFRFEKPGRHNIKVCMGTACHVKGSERLSDLVTSLLGVDPGRTTPDGEFTFDRVACLGACALAPVVVTDKQVHGKMDSGKLKTELNRLSPKKEGV